MPIYDTIIHRIHYVENDISSLVKPGENVIEFHIGAGWYGQNQSRNEGMVEYGQLKLAFKILEGDKLISKSDTDVEWRDSYITRTNIYFGETHDARLGGLMLRTKNCRRRLLDYCNGAIDSIPELCEDVLVHDGGNVGGWSKIITACPI
jgi:hypothetical protein